MLFFAHAHRAYMRGYTLPVQPRSANSQKPEITLCSPQFYKPINFLPGKIRFSLFKKTSSTIKLNRSILDQAHKVCCLYDSCFNSLKDEIKMDVLIGLGCNGALVSKMWHFLWLTLGLDVDKIVRAAVAANGSGASADTKGGGAGTGEHDPLFSVITLCCQMTQYRLV